MKYYFFSIILCLLSISLLTCGKYRPDDVFQRKGEWIYSVNTCNCGGTGAYRDTIRPMDMQNGIWGAKIQISDGPDETTVLMHVNDNLASAVQFEFYETGFEATYMGNLDDDLGVRLYSEADSFLYSTPSDVSGYSRVIATPDFPFKSDIYQNEMDTFTVNFFKFID